MKKVRAPYYLLPIENHQNEYRVKSRTTHEGIIPLWQRCPTFSSTGPPVLNGISLWAATNNSKYNGVQYRLEFFIEYILT